MGLKCSVLGHAYGETTVERDREERGSEVVITIRDLETCNRGGDTRIVTENKEVTTIETADDVPDVTAEDAMAAMDTGDDDSDAGDSGTADAATPEPGSGEGALIDDAEDGTAVAAGSTGGPSPDAVEDQGAEIIDDDADEREAEAVDDELNDPTIENDADVPGDSEDEDAVIIDDGPGVAAEDASADARDEAPDDAGVADEPAPFDEPASDDEAEEDPLGEWPEETLRDDADWKPSEDLTGTVGEVDPERERHPEISSNSAVTVPEGEFHCRGCDYSTSVEASSLRAGDYCPECRSATLVHRADE